MKLSIITINYNNAFGLEKAMKRIINHQSTFYRPTIFTKQPYDEILKIIVNRKVNVKSIIFGNSNMKVVDKLSTAKTGLSLH